MCRRRVAWHAQALQGLSLLHRAPSTAQHLEALRYEAAGGLPASLTLMELCAHRVDKTRLL